MTILILPTMRCNFRCVYCFEHDSVKDDKEPLDFDFNAIKRSLDTLQNDDRYRGSDIGIHGGECTMMSPRELESVLKLIYESQDRDGNPFNRSGITSNGYNINDSFIRLFKKYNTNVGISIDGPESLNTLRGPNPKNEKVTLGYNHKMKKTLRKLRREDLSVAIMCILHTENAGDDDKLEELKEWILWLADLGIDGGRLNPMYEVPWNQHYQLSNDRLAEVWKQLFDLTIDYGLRWNPFREMIDNLLGFSSSPCTFGSCDYFRTSTVGILPDGTITNCDRTFEKGLHVRAEGDMLSGRYDILPRTQCKDCRYWNICHAGCPSCAVDSDWRNKSVFCDAIYQLYEYTEKKIKNFFPNIRLVTENDEAEPFKLMSYRYSSRPSAYGAAPLIKDPPPVPTLSLGGHIDRHGDKPHGDHYDTTRTR